MIKSNTKHKPARMSLVLPRSNVATRDTVAFDVCVPRNMLSDIPDLTNVQPKRNKYFKNSYTFQIKLKLCTDNIFESLKTPCIYASTPEMSYFMLM